MPNPPNPPAAPANSTGRNPSGSAPPPPAQSPTPVGADDVAALMLTVLRNINRQSAATPPLNANAAQAVANFRAIALSLRTLADIAP